MPLTPELVNSVFKKCFLTEAGKNVKTIPVEFGDQTFKFDHLSIEANKVEIEKMLEELPPQFKEGESFLNACLDKNGNLWTGVHGNIMKLFLLGMAIGKVEYTFPKEVWPSLHGGMPFYTVKSLAA